uniref:UAS domain-containing protein n=1 Tax=Heterorhabditis bacteriophora TaxID=37862 RepID=A0A1I7WW27_HETBA
MDFGLDEEQTEKLRQFQEITNIEDHEVAMCTLASLDWNVERAIEAHLMNDETPMDLPVEETRSRRVPAVIDLSSRRGLDVVDLVENDDLDVEPVLSQRTRQAVRKTPADLNQTVDMDIVRPTSSYRNGHSRRDHDEEVLTDDDDDYPLGHDVEDIERTSKNHNYAVPLIPTECDCVEEALHNFVSVFEARFSGIGCHMPPFYTEPLPNAIKEAFEAPVGGAEERRPLALYIHHDGSIAANIFPSKVSRMRSSVIVITIIIDI